MFRILKVSCGQSHPESNAAAHIIGIDATPVANGITCSMSGKGSCYDNAVVESFFAALKRERTKRRKYRTRDEARANVFDYIERFYNRKRRHGYVGNISPVHYENRALGGLAPI